MKKFIYVITLFTSVMQAQVGIGTTNPTAKLEIDASADAIPALEIVPSITAPTGTANGQIAVIDGSLYIYDVTRAKWLSSETISFSFGLNGTYDDGYLQFSRVQNGLSGAKILKDATIVGITAVTSGGNPTKLIEIDGSTLGLAFANFNLIATQYLSSITDINVPEGENINIYVADPGPTISNLSVTIYLKWRK